MKSPPDFTTLVIDPNRAQCIYMKPGRTFFFRIPYVWFAFGAITWQAWPREYYVIRMVNLIRRWFYAKLSPGKCTNPAINPHNSESKLANAKYYCKCAKLSI